LKGLPRFGVHILHKYVLFKVQPNSLDGTSQFSRRHSFERVRERLSAPETGYHGQESSWFSLMSPCKSWDVTIKKIPRLRSTSLPIHHSGILPSDAT